MEKRITVLAVAFTVVAFTQPAFAQQTGDPARIAILRNSPPPPQYLTAFREGLKEFGYPLRLRFLCPLLAKSGHKVSAKTRLFIPIRP